jgi:hypothetical protein
MGQPLGKLNNKDQSWSWFRSTFCTADGCAEVTRTADGVQMRSSTCEEVIVTYTLEEWNAFIEGAKAGEFDFVIVSPIES